MPRLLKKIGKIVLKTILILLGVLILFIILIQTRPVQNFLRGKAQTYLQKKLQTKVEIGKIYIGFPKSINLEGLYVEDRQKDTLLYSGSLQVNMNMWKLFSGAIVVNDVKWKNLTATISRQLPDTTFNFQFIIDAFASQSTEPTTPDTAALQLQVKHVQLDDIRLRYHDTLTGNDMRVVLAHLDTHLDVLDPTHMIFDIPTTTVKGLRAFVYQRKPLVEPEPASTDSAEAADSPNMHLLWKKINLEDCYVDYGNDASALYALLDVGKLNLRAKQFNLPKQQMTLENVQMANTKAAIRLGKQPAAKVVKEEVKKEVKEEAEAGWVVSVNNLALDNNQIRFDDDNSPREKYGIDYMHLHVQDLTLHASDLLYRSDSIAGTITKGSLREKDFQLKQLKTSFVYTDRQAFLHDLLLETPNTRIERNLGIRYASIKTLADNIGQMQVELDVRNSKVYVKDVLTFAPMLRDQPAFVNPNATWLLNGKVKGRLNDLQLSSLQLQGLQQTQLDVSGTLKGLPEMKQLQANLQIKNSSTTAKDIKSMLPPNTLPSNITVPDKLRLSGSINGSMEDVVSNLQLVTSLGNASVQGRLQHPLDSNRIAYDMKVTTRSLDLRRLLNQADLGPVTLDVTAKGTGRVPATMNAAVQGNIASATYKQYEYRNLHLDGSIAQQVFTLKAGIQNEPIHISLDASGNVAGTYPSAKFNIIIDSIKTKTLNFTTQNAIYRGNITGDFASTNPDSLQGSLFVTKSLLVNEEHRVELDTLQLLAAVTDTGKLIDISCDLLKARLLGQYNLTQMGDVIQQAIQPYFALQPDTAIKKVPYDFTLTATLYNKPQLKSLFPSLVRLEPVELNSRISDTGGIDASFTVPVLIYDSNQVHNLRVLAVSDTGQLNVLAGIDRFDMGGTMTLYKTTVRADIADNNIDFALNTRDKTDKTNYHLEGRLAQPQQGTYAISLKPDSLMLNYQAWTVNDSNKITLTPTQLFVDQFELKQGTQLLKAQSQQDTAHQPLRVDFSKFRIATLMGFVQSDSLLVDGEINGGATINDLMSSPTFVSDLTVNNLSFNRDTLGNIEAKVSNPQPNNFVADIALSGRGNDMTIQGNYVVRPENQSSFDLDMAIKQLQLSTLEGASMGNIKQASGTLSGNFKITGNMDKPSVNGELLFNKVRFIPSIMNSFVATDNQKVTVNDQGIVFNNFTITDSVNNKATLDGTAYTTNFTGYKFDLQFNANNFQALSTTKKDNKLYWGRLFFNSRLHIGGTEQSPKIDGTLKVNDKTVVTVVLPQEDPEVVDREGIVRFVDRDAIPNDSLFMTAYDSLNTAAITDLDLNVNITVDKGAEFNLIVDEGNGDLLKVKGEAALNGGIDPSGKITLTGSYELQEGSYDLTVNFLKRKFNIQKGSKLVWQGEPTNADVDITAIYIANTAPIDLVEKQLGNISATDRNMYRQRVPFEVHLKMKGQLLKPLITFDIQLPQNKSYNVDKGIIGTANTRLEELRQDPSELNKQVFALLLLNRFIGDNPFTTGNSSLTAEALARQSVSKLLSEQLNALAANLIGGVDINFDLETSEDYTTGQRRNRTDLNVSLSKSLLNDRLTVTVGNNFALENPNAARQTTTLADNVALDYKLSKDGRYLLRAYRKNEYEGVLEGYIIETGVGFIITLDYNRFRDIFMSKKKRQQLREQRRKEREEERKQEEREKTGSEKVPETGSNPVPSEKKSSDTGVINFRANKKSSNQ